MICYIAVFPFKSSTVGPVNEFRVPHNVQQLLSSSRIVYISQYNSRYMIVQLLNTEFKLNLEVGYIQNVIAFFTIWCTLNDKLHDDTSSLLSILFHSDSENNKSNYQSRSIHAYFIIVSQVLVRFCYFWYHLTPNNIICYKLFYKLQEFLRGYVHVLKTVYCCQVGTDVGGGKQFLCAHWLILLTLYLRGPHCDQFSIGVSDIH